ncbi:cytochrome P450 [Stereum hirsutum FP-91666 SS1]|uniref:cytochrome P450 n=1 Tax=Stereum hirsutum (strain FP-91666) TaxID=721885 RepID=UPI000444A3A4|nr:cytochrome P450 [Stereum hirsutum FP-91666 SS1]EIM84997.1 cytochrome P450 [Stereum hirsutum FP-91666 SS1]
MSILLNAILCLASLPVLLVLFVVFLSARQYIRQASLHEIPGPQPDSLITGNLKTILGLNAWDFHARLAKSYGNVVRIWGFLGDTHLYIKDPRALYHILTKEQYVFEETDMFIKTNKSTFGMGLLSTLGEHHRRQRKLLNPVFSIKHMRYMIPIFFRISHQFTDILNKKIDQSDGSAEIDALDWNTRVALELIGQGGLGHSFNSLDEHSESRYSTALKTLVPTLTKLNLWRQVFPWVADLGTPALRRWIGTNLPWPDLNRVVYLTDIMEETSKTIFYSKKAALERGDDAVALQVGEGRDIMSVLMKANMEAAEKDRLPDIELLGQMSTLTFAAMDTTSTALSRILHLLSMNQPVQDRLREELVNARKEAGGDFDYDALMGLPFLEAVCRETLRMYPPLTQLLRTARKDTILPLGTPLSVNGNTLSELFIPANTGIFIAVKAVNISPELWGADAGEWNPERWLSPLPESIANAGIPGVYANTLTFLGGGRACIGFKFSELEMKVVLSLLITNFRYSPSKKNIEWKSTNIATPWWTENPRSRSLCRGLSYCVVFTQSTCEIRTRGEIS